jgi:predicted ATPase with chaperone activity
MRCFGTPKSLGDLSELGLERALIQDLILKHLLSLGDFKMADVAERVRLPISIVEAVLEEHRKEKLIEVKGSANYTKTSYIFRLTEYGRRKGQEALEQCRYVGPAPVCLDDYCDMVQRQTLKGAIGGEKALRTALSDLVINEDVMRRLGPAMISGQAVFIYGPSGNGKTSIAEAIGRALPEHIYLPYAVSVGGQVISVFDPASHVAVEGPGDPGECDARWVLVKRPVVNAGSELSLKMFDLTFHGVSRYYEASLQMKANNGLFILDDFGRQQVDPVSILNRWITPLERQVDYMTLQSGMKFMIPFDVLVIFSTNIDPKDLVHEAFLRRLRYKIKIDRPTEEEFLEIFKKACKSKGLDFNQEVYSYLDQKVYGAQGIARNACHPRDLMDHIVTHSRFFANAPELTLESISAACSDYFVPM